MKVTSAVPAEWVPGATPARPLSGLRQTLGRHLWRQPGGGGGRSGQVQAVKTMRKLGDGGPRPEEACTQSAQESEKQGERDRRQGQRRREPEAGEGEGVGTGGRWGAQGLLWLLWFPDGHSDAYRPSPQALSWHGYRSMGREWLHCSPGSR